MKSQPYKIVSGSGYVPCPIEDAKDAAENETSYRGGKYGCEVVEVPRGRWHEDLETVQVAYVPSPYEGVLGEGCQQVDHINEGWKDRAIENFRERHPRLKIKSDDEPNADVRRGYHEET